MFSVYKRTHDLVSRPLRAALRRLSRWYAVTCARDDARRLGFVVPERLPAPLTRAN